MENDNAQMTIDYLAGLGIFLLSIAFIFQFMLNLFVPFQSGSEEVTLGADRAGTVLIERLIDADSSKTTNVVDQGKLDFFIRTKLNYSDENAYNSALQETGLYSDDIIFDMNVSVEYLNGTFMNKGGPELPENINIGQIRRIVLIINSSTGYNETAIVSVRVW